MELVLFLLNSLYWTHKLFTIHLYWQLHSFFLSGCQQFSQEQACRVVLQGKITTTGQ